MVTVTEVRMGAMAAAATARMRAGAPWVLAGGLGFWHFLIQVVGARTVLFQRYDDGFLLTTITDTLHGQLPITDFYQPYGVGLGFPGALAHLVGLGSVFDLRVVYGVFPALATSLATVFVWRRCGWLWGLLVGLVSLGSNIPRYSMGYCALFAFALIVDRHFRDSGRRNGAATGLKRVWPLLVAAFVLSLAGWARSEYAVFALIWSAIVALFYRGPWRWQIATVSLFFSALPTIVIVATGGGTHLLWVLRYYLSSGPSGYSAQRGHPIQWSLFGDRLNELFHFQLSSPTAGGLFASYGFASYGVAFVVIAGVIVMLATRRGRSSLLVEDRSLLAVFMAAASAALLYFLAGSNWGVYAPVGAFVFWAAAALLVPRLSVSAVLVAALVVGYPLIAGAAPGAVIDAWNSRPPTSNRPYVPNLQHIPLGDDGGASSMASLIAVWHHLGLDGRSVLSVELRNDVASGVDAEVGYLLNAPAAAWPLAYDPGLVNRSDVERATVEQLCADRAAVVQTNFGSTGTGPVLVGSRLLDEFLATDYGIRGIAGFYRVLLPDTPRCVLPWQLPDSTLVALRDRWIALGQPAEAGALGIALMERARARGWPIDPADASAAALGGYQLQADEMPAGPLGPSLVALSGQAVHAPLVVAAARPWPSDLEALAAQTAWLEHRDLENPLEPIAARQTLALALRHPSWPGAIANVSAVVPPSPGLFRRLAQSGAAGLPQFDSWRLSFFRTKHRTQQAVAAAVALVADYRRLNDPVDAAQAEVNLAGQPGVSPGCARALLLRARATPGMDVRYPSGPTQPCYQARIGSLL